MATRSSTLAWRIPWIVKSMGSQRVGHDLTTLKKKKKDITGQDPHRSLTTYKSLLGVLDT